MKTPRDIISKMYTNAANLKHIAETGTINGSLLIDIEKAILEYHNQFEQHQTPTESEINEAALNLFPKKWIDDPIRSGTISGGQIDWSIEEREAFIEGVQWLQNYQTNKVVEDNTNTQKTQVGDDQTQGREKRVNFSPVDVNTYLPKQDGYVLAYCDTAGLWEKVWFDDALQNAFKHRYTHWLPWPDSPRNWQASQPNPAIAVIEARIAEVKKQIEQWPSDLSDHGLHSRLNELETLKETILKQIKG